MNEERLVVMLRESKDLVERAIGDTESELMKALLTVKVFELRTASQSGEYTSRKDAMREVVEASRELEINELINIVNPSTQVETVTVFGYYLVSENVPEFENADISKLYTKCKKKQPRNLSDAISSAIRRGYLVESGTKSKSGARMVRLTSTGRDFVLSRLGVGNGS
jgi:hypothetical protein